MNTDYYVDEKKDSWHIVYKGKTKICVYRLFPGILLGYNQIETRELPMAPFTPFFRSEIVMRVNFSLAGICEIRTKKGDYIYVKGGHVSISSDKAAKGFSYPTGFYTGIELYIQDEALKKLPDGFDPFGIDFGAIFSTYLRHQSTLSADMQNELAPLAQSLHALLKKESPDLSQLRLYSLLVLRMLTAGAVVLNPEPISVLTPRQVECAKTACEILTNQISRRITIPEIATQLGIGESSLKNWFRIVYGKSISAYIRDLRIQTAKRLLVDSDLTVFEIAGMVGYENQAKFTAMFHKYCGCTPSTYRRQYADFSEK